MNYQTVEVELRVKLCLRLPPDNMLPADGPYSKPAMLCYLLQRWEDAAQGIANPNRSDPGVTFMHVDQLDRESGL